MLPVQNVTFFHYWPRSSAGWSLCVSFFAEYSFPGDNDLYPHNRLVIGFKSPDHQKFGHER